MNSMDLRDASEIDPSFLSFYNRLHQRANVFLYFCVFSSEKDKNTMTKYFFVFFSTIGLHQCTLKQSRSYSLILVPTTACKLS